MVFLILIALLLLLLLLFLYVIKISLRLGLRQKFGKFDMPPSQLDEFIHRLLSDETIRESDLPLLRKKIIELGYTSLSEEEVIIELKNTLYSLDNDIEIK